MRKILLLVLSGFFFTSAVQGNNLVPHSGFETGVYRLWRSPYQYGNLVDNCDLDYSIFHDGTASLRLTTWQGSYYYSGYNAQISSVFSVPVVEPGRYTLSAWVKSDSEKGIKITCGGINISDKVLPEDGWKRVVGTGMIESPVNINISVSGTTNDQKAIHAGYLWLDSLQLEKGETATAWQAAGPEIGLVCKTLANIFYEGEPVEIYLMGDNPTGKDTPLDIKTFLYDCLGKQLPVETRTERFLLKSKVVSEKRFSFPSNRKGAFRFQIIAEGDINRRLEIPFYVIPKPVPDGWNPFGLYLQMTGPAMERASRLGLYWNNTLSAGGQITEWYKVSDKTGNYFFDRYVHKLKIGKEKYFLRYVGNISNSGFVERFPEFAESDKEVPGETIKFETRGKVRYLKKSAYRDYITRMATAYSNYISYWQIIDEMTFNHETVSLYNQIMVESARAFKNVSPETKVLATYPFSMAYTYLRAGKEYVDGIYDLGRDLRRIRYAVKAAEIANKDFPIFFYDCGVLFNYLSESFNGWGKLAGRTKEPVEGEAFQQILDEFVNRLDNTFQRNIRPAGAGGLHTKAVILYHARLPGGRSQSAFDEWGHPALVLTVFSAFNSLTAKGYSLGELGISGWEGFLFSLGEKNGYLIVLKPEPDKKSVMNEYKIPTDLTLKQIDFWTNEITIQKDDGNYISLSQPSYSYLIVSEDHLEKAKRFLKDIITGDVK
jgi:hypothetical protein